MQVKIVAGSLFVHWKIAYFNLMATEQWLVVSLPYFVTMRNTLLTISYFQLSSHDETRDTCCGIL